MHENEIEIEIMLRVVVVDAYLSCQYATARGLLRAIQTSITRSSCSEYGHNSIAIVSDSLGHNRSPSSHYRHHRADTNPNQSITDPSRRYVCVCVCVCVCAACVPYEHGVLQLWVVCQQPIHGLEVAVGACLPEHVLDCRANEWIGEYVNVPSVDRRSTYRT